MKKSLLFLAGLVAFSSAVALAAPASPDAKHHSKHHAKKSSMQECIDRSPAVMEYKAGMARMHREMDIVYSGDADMDFTAGMVPHHQGAVDMAETLLKFGKDENLKKLAEWIIATQEQEIAMMKHWLNVRGYKASPPPPAMKGHAHHATARYASPEVAEVKAVREYVQAMEVMHKGMDIQYTGNADIDFVRGMIPHHQGAVDMAITLKRFGKNAELSALADDIIRSQRQEIAFMKDWLAKKGIK